MFGADVAMTKSFCFFRGDVQHSFAVFGQGYLDGSGDAFALCNSTFDLLANLLFRRQAGKQNLSSVVVFPEEAEKKVFCFDVWAAVLASVIARVEDDAAGLFGVALEHDSASLFQVYGIRQLA